MPRYVRSPVPGGTYFFTLALADRGSDLLVREIALLREVYRSACRSRPFETLAICVLPDHLHALWRMPDGDADFALRWSLIKSGFSRRLPEASCRSRSQRRRREKGVWQRRYWEHQVRDAEDFARHVDYIHFNPVKHALVQQVREWPHSSFHGWVQRGDLPAEWGLAQGVGEGRYGEV